VLGATVVVKSVLGGRRIPMGELLTGPYETALQPDELITEVFVPERPGRSAFAEATRRHNDFAIVSVAGVASLDAAGSFSDLRLGFGGVADTVVLAPRAAAVLMGQRPEPDAVEAAIETCRGEIDPSSDSRASAEYRRHLAGEYLRRIIQKLTRTVEVAT
jgi:CO/xanthine dehydrogenase FAD-binding subunit